MGDLMMKTKHIFLAFIFMLSLVTACGNTTNSVTDPDGDDGLFEFETNDGNTSTSVGNPSYKDPEIKVDPTAIEIGPVVDGKVSIEGKDFVELDPTDNPDEVTITVIVDGKAVLKQKGLPGGGFSAHVAANLGSVIIVEVSVPGKTSVSVTASGANKAAPTKQQVDPDSNKKPAVSLTPAECTQNSDCPDNYVCEEYVCKLTVQMMKSIMNTDFSLAPPFDAEDADLGHNTHKMVENNLQDLLEEAPQSIINTVDNADKDGAALDAKCPPSTLPIGVAYYQDAVTGVGRDVQLACQSINRLAGRYAITFTPRLSNTRGLRSTVDSCPYLEGRGQTILQGLQQKTADSAVRALKINCGLLLAESRTGGMEFAYGRTPFDGRCLGDCAATPAAASSRLQTHSFRAANSFIIGLRVELGQDLQSIGFITKSLSD